jgi:hypothetical protein
VKLRPEQAIARELAALRQRVRALEGERDDLLARLDRAGEVVSRLVDALEQDTIEPGDGWELAQAVREDLADVLELEDHWFLATPVLAS